MVARPYGLNLGRTLLTRTRPKDAAMRCQNEGIPSEGVSSSFPFWEIRLAATSAIRSMNLLRVIRLLSRCGRLRNTFARTDVFNETLTFFGPGFGPGRSSPSRVAEDAHLSLFSGAQNAYRLSRGVSRFGLGAPALDTAERFLPTRP